MNTSALAHPDPALTTACLAPPARPTPWLVRLREACLHREALLLVPVILLGGFLRLEGIHRAGICFADGSWYASDARLWHRCAATLADPRAWQAVLNFDKAGMLQLMDEHGVDRTARYYKPCQGYTFLVAAVMTLVGDTPSAVPITNALFSTCALLVLYPLVRRSFGARVAWLAALLLALSPYDLVYARGDLADAVATCFILTGVWLWSRLAADGCVHRRRAWLAGVCFGYAVTCHYRTLPVAVLLAAMDGLHAALSAWRRQSSPRDLIRRFIGRWLRIGCGLLIPILAVESVFQAGALAARMADAWFPFTSYLRCAAWWIGLHMDGDAHAWPDVAGIAVYADYFVHAHGWAFLGLAGVGAAACLCRNVREWWPWLVPLGLLSLLLFQPYFVARALAPAVPFVCLLAALGAVRLAEFLGRARRPARIGILAALAAAPLVHAGERALHARSFGSDVPRAAEFLTEVRDRAAVPNEMLYRIYAQGHGVRLLAGESIPRMPPPQAVAWLREQGVRWVVTDPQHWHHPPTSDEFAFWEDLEHLLRRRAAPAAEFAHLSGHCWEFLAEAGIAHRADEMERSGGGLIRIYDLSALDAAASALAE